MQQIFNYILKNSTKLLFLLLLGISIILTIQTHSFHRSKVINSANFFSGGVYDRIHNFNEYLNLKSENELLAAENARLNMILFNNQDSLEKVRTVWPIIDTTYHMIRGKVINNQYNVHENFLTINVGESQGIKTYMGVINGKGIVGIVENISKNYATVISILNIKSQINAKIKNAHHFGTLTWNGKNTGLVQLMDIPRLANVKKGDTIVTGNESSIFPENIDIGIIHKIYTDDQTNYFTIDVKLFNDMTNLGHIYVIENKHRNEIIALEKATRNE
jgi:rod shape-determining protein MreC